MATLKIDHHLIAGIRTNLSSARVRADLKPITDRVINPVLSGAISVPDDVKAEIESLQASLLRIVPTLPKGVAVNPIDIDALVTPVPAPLPQPLPAPALAPAVSPAQSPDPNAGRMSVFSQQAAMQAIQGAAAAAAATATPVPAPAPAVSPTPSPDLSRQLASAQAEITRLQNELQSEQEHAHRLETSLGGARDKVRETEAKHEKDLAALRAAQQSAAAINADLTKAQAEVAQLTLELQSTSTAKARAEQTNLELADKIAKLDAALAKTTEQAENALRELREHNTRLAAELNAQTTLVASRDKTISELTEQIETLRQALAEKAKPIVSSPILTGTPLEMIKQAITLALGKLTEEAEAINTSIGEINANIAAKESDAADLDLQITARMAQMHQADERFQSRIDNLESEFAAATDSDEGIKIARQTIAKLTAELEAAIDPAKRDKINAKLSAAQKFLAQLETGLRRELKLGGREQIAAEKERDLARRRRELDTLVARKTKTSVELDRSLSAREQARLGITPLVGQLNEIRGILGLGEHRVSGLLDSLPITMDSGSRPEDNT